MFKVERTILSIATFRLALDNEAVELSLGESESYSIWTVENRLTNQIILRDITKKTRSWLMVQNSRANEANTTRLFFGSVVIPKEASENEQATFGFLFHVFGRFHQLYSKALLNAAYNKLLRKDNST